MLVKNIQLISVLFYKKNVTLYSNTTLNKLKIDLYIIIMIEKLKN
jgi:hypothetical protein